MGGDFARLIATLILSNCKVALRTHYYEQIP